MTAFSFQPSFKLRLLRDTGNTASPVWNSPQSVSLFVTDQSTHAKGALMQYRSPRALPLELVRLMEMQIESIQKETFVGVTDAERREYEERAGPH